MGEKRERAWCFVWNNAPEDFKVPREGIFRSRRIVLPSTSVLRPLCSTVLTFCFFRSALLYLAVGAG